MNAVTRTSVDDLGAPVRVAVRFSSLAAVIQICRSVGIASRALFNTLRAFSYVSRRARMRWDVNDVKMNRLPLFDLRTRGFDPDPHRVRQVLDGLRVDCLRLVCRQTTQHIYRPKTSYKWSNLCDWLTIRRTASSHTSLPPQVPGWLPPIPLGRFPQLEPTPLRTVCRRERRLCWWNSAPGRTSWLSAVNQRSLCNEDKYFLFVFMRFSISFQLRYLQIHSVATEWSACVVLVDRFIQHKFLWRDWSWNTKNSHR